MFSEIDSNIINNPDHFSEDHIPLHLPARKSEIKELTFCISPAAKGKKPIHAWIFGKPGTGKTSACRSILRNLENKTDIKGIYINCWENSTFFAVLDKMVKELRILGAEKLNTSYKLERIQKHIGDKPFILFLDEIDHPHHTERDDILYNFCNMGKIGIVAICQSKYVLQSLDERIRSRLNAQSLEFTPYSEDDLLYILNRRASSALVSNTYNETILKSIAKLAAGDARVAIQTLKNATYLAEKEDSKKINDEHVNKGYCSAKDVKNTDHLNKLTDHHIMLYTIIKKSIKIRSGKLWKSYLAKCKRKKVNPIALRTYAEYIRKLIEMDIIKAERALGRGKVRIFRITE